MTSFVSREEMIKSVGGRPKYPWPCPRCSAPPFESCQSATGKRTETHAVRYRRP